MIDALRPVLGARRATRLSLDGFRAAAVLVPFVVEPGQPARLILTVRHDDLPTHAGQIAFPGGKREASDPSAAATAVRETEEELGLPAGRVEVIGELDDVPTPSRFMITPVVGLVHGPVALAPSAREVHAVFFPEIDALRQAESHSVTDVAEWMGVRYEMHEYRYGGFRIWGATARILWQLFALLPPTP